MSQVSRDPESKNGRPFNLAPANPALKGFRSWHSLNCLFKVGICEQRVSCPAAAPVAECFHSSFSLISFLSCFSFFFCRGGGGLMGVGGAVGNFSAFPPWLFIASIPPRTCRHREFPTAGLRPTAGLPGTSSCFTAGLLFVSPLLKLIMFSGQVPQAITTKGK